MSRDKNFRGRTKLVAFIAAACLAFGGIGALAARHLSVASAQARSWVNQGQTELARGDRAGAVLAFERARLLSPRSDFVRAALVATDARDPEASVDRAVRWISPREWFSLTVAFGWVAGVSIALEIVRRRRSPLVRRVALGSGVALLLSMGGFAESSLSSRVLAVVTGPTGVLVAPYDAAGASADLRAGTVVVTGSRYGGFVQVRGPHDAHGWVPSSAVHFVVGASS